MKKKTNRIRRDTTYTMQKTTNTFIKNIVGHHWLMERTPSTGQNTIGTGDIWDLEGISTFLRDQESRIKMVFQRATHIEKLCHVVEGQERMHPIHWRVIHYVIWTRKWGLKTCKRAVKHGSKVVLTGTEEGNHGNEKILDGNS